MLDAIRISLGQTLDHPPNQGESRRIRAVLKQIKKEIRQEQPYKKAINDIEYTKQHNEFVEAANKIMPTEEKAKKIIVKDYKKWKQKQ